MLRVRLGASACRLYAAICTWGVLIWAPAPAAPRRAATSSSSDELIVPSDPIVPEYLRVPKDTFRTPWRYADDCKLMEVMYHTHWAMEASGFSRWLDANAPDWLLRSWEEAGVSAVDAATVLFADVRVWADRLRRVP
jgi:NAD-dependent oxidoreductase involved in siderophore biosynthesis